MIELLTTAVTSSQSNTSFAYFITNRCKGSLGTEPMCGMLIRERARTNTSGDAPYRAEMLLYPLPTGQRTAVAAIPNSELHLYLHSTPVVIGSLSYAGVVQATNLSDASESGATVTYYWAPGYGLVRRRIRALNRPVQTWTLVRERIVQ